MKGIFILEKLIRKINKLKKPKQLFSENLVSIASENNTPILKTKEENMALIEEFRNRNFDIKIREFCIGNVADREAYILFIDEYTDKKLISKYIEQLLLPIHDVEGQKVLFNNDPLSFIENYLLNAASIAKTNNFEDVISSILEGNCTLFVNGYNEAMLINAVDEKHRAISEPFTESSLRGSREGFVEKLYINLSLLRNRIKSPKLSFELQYIGRDTKTKICIAYMEGVVDKALLKEVKKRLGSINVDAVFETGTIEQLIQDHKFSPFATIGNSEKPDKVAAKLMEGKIAIMCDGTPFVLIIPYFFLEAFHSTEDYYTRPYYSTFMRILRISSLFITLLLLPLYLALITFHQEMIPSVLFQSISQSVENIPFPAVVETILSVFLFELIREAGVRMPSPAGQTVSIVGTLIVGQAAVQASLISNSMVIIISLSAVASFIITPVLDAIIIIRFIFILLSGIFGLYGLVAGIIIMLAHMCSLKSFGQEYLKPFSPVLWEGLKDSFIRVPMQMRKRW